MFLLQLGRHKFSFTTPDLIGIYAVMRQGNLKVHGSFSYLQNTPRIYKNVLEGLVREAWECMPVIMYSFDPLSLGIVILVLGLLFPGE